MKYLTICLFILLNVTLVLQAQKPVVELNAPFTMKGPKVFAEHLSSDETGHYLFFEEKKTNKIGLLMLTENYYFEKYDLDGKLVFSKLIEETILKFSVFNEKIFFISAIEGSSDDQISYALNMIDKNGETISTQEIMVPKASDDVYLRKRSLVRSPNASKLLWVARSGESSKKNNFETYLFVLDTDLKVVWTKGIQIPVTERKFEATDFTVTDKGEVFFLGKTFEKNRRIEPTSHWNSSVLNFSAVEDESLDYQLDLFQVTKDSKTSVKTSINSEKQLKSSRLALNKNDQLVLINLYGDSPKGPSQGILSQPWNPQTNSWDTPLIRPFSEKELMGFGKKITKKDPKSRSLGLEKGYRLTSVFSKTNGEMVAVAEENIIKVTTGGITGNGTEYLSNHLIVFKFSDLTTVKGVTIIPKIQRSGFSDYLSYQNFELDNRVYFIYNDNPDNLTKKITDPDKIKPALRMKDQSPVITYIDDNGNLVKKAILKSSQETGVLQITKLDKINDNILFLSFATPKYSKKTLFQFGSLYFE